MKKILITGALGLIGSTLNNLLNDEGYVVCPIDIRADPTNLSPNNILDFNHIKKMIKGCVGVVHLAAVSRVIWGEENPWLCRKVNVDGTKNIINACLESPIKPWLIYASSREVYGQQNIFPVQEDCTFRPHNHYAKSKIDAEKLVNDARDRGLQTTTLRFSNVFGGLCDYSERVVPAFCSNSLKGLPLQVNGGDSLLDFTYVDDVVKGIIQVIKLMSTQNESLPAIHFTTGKATSLLELANLTVQLCNSSSDIILKQKDSIYPSKFYGNYTRAKSLLGWEPKYNIRVGILNYLEKLKNNTAILYPSTMVRINENFESDTWLSA
ncbi:MAG: NAD(P)-dependent oxidoreductase [Alphaproteobacteria bacterium]